MAVIFLEGTKMSSCHIARRSKGAKTKGLGFLFDV